MKNKTTLVLFLVLLLTNTLSAQKDFSKKPKKQKAPKSVYLEIGVGTGESSFRDLGTSPLLYGANPEFFSGSLIRKNNFMESFINFSYSQSSYVAPTVTTLSLSSVKTPTLNISTLRSVNKESAKKIKMQVGGLLSGTTNIRDNPDFQNTAIGQEFIFNAMGSVKLMTDLSRTKVKNKKLLFLRYTLHPRKRELSIRLNAGLINGNYRNGFVYIGQTSVLNEVKLFDDYNFNIFQGQRYRSTVKYAHYLRNGNAINVSYLWDFYQTNSERAPFDMVHHVVQLSFPFKLNNK